MRTNRSGYIVLLAVLAAFLHCGGPPPRDTLRIGIGSGIVSLDPHTQDEEVTVSVLANLYEGLVGFDANLKLGPCLAEGYSNPDELTWRFRLRPGARFHDGRPLLARDVVYSLERARSHPQSVFRSLLAVVERIEEVTATEVRIVTRRPQPVLIKILTAVAILPRGFEPGESAVGTGPYKLASVQIDQEIALEAFPGYWGSPPHFRRAVFRVVPQDRWRGHELVGGRLDLDAEPSLQMRVIIEKDPDLRLITQEGASVTMLGMVVGGEPADNPLSDRRVRQAISLALDRRELVRSLFNWYATPASQLVPRNIFGFEPDLPVITPDLPKAQALLQEAGFGQGVRLRLDHSNATGPEGEMIRRQLAEVGIGVTPNPVNWEELYSRISTGESRFHLVGYSTTTADVSELFNSLIHTNEPGSEYGLENTSGYSNPEVDRLIEAADREYSPQRRQRILQDAMRLVMEDLPLIPLHVWSQSYGLRRDLEWTPRADALIRAAEFRPR